MMIHRIRSPSIAAVRYLSASTAEKPPVSSAKGRRINTRDGTDSQPPVAAAKGERRNTRDGTDSQPPVFAAKGERRNTRNGTNSRSPVSDANGGRRNTRDGTNSRRPVSDANGGRDIRNGTNSQPPESSTGVRKIRTETARRLHTLAYSKESVVDTIRKWKEEGQRIRRSDLTPLVRELRKNKRYKYALEICEWMKIQPDMELFAGDYAIHLDLIAKFLGLNSAEKFFTDLPEKMKDAFTYNALLNAYVKCKESEKAEALMEKMSECGFLNTPLPYNHMLSLYMSLGNFQKLSEIIKLLKKNETSPDIITYNIWLSACASQNCVETAEKVYLELNNAKLKPDWITYSTMISIYTKNSFREKAESMIREMEGRVLKDVRGAHASMISLYTGLENKKGVWRIWKKIKSTYQKVNDVEYTCMIVSLLKLEEIREAEKVYDEWECISSMKDPRIPNLLLGYYISSDKMEKAEAFLKRMVEKEIKPVYTTWELLTWGYLKQRQLQKALDCFSNAVNCVKTWNPDEKLVHEVCKVVEELGDVERAEECLVILRTAGHVNVEIYKSLVRTHAKAEKVPLGVAERMKKDNLMIDEETETLLQLTSKFYVGEIPKEVLTEQIDC